MGAIVIHALKEPAALIDTNLALAVDMNPDPSTSDTAVTPSMTHLQIQPTVVPRELLRLLRKAWLLLARAEVIQVSLSTRTSSRR